MAPLPVRGPGVRQLDLPLPPRRMPQLRDGRPLKRWRYVGVYGPELMLCVGDARVAGVPQRWWAVALPDGTLRERTTSGRGGVRLEPGLVRVHARDVVVELDLVGDVDSAGEAATRGPVEVVSPHGSSFIWTRKQADLVARGRVRVGEREWAIDGRAFVDESAGYHARHTRWRWSAGIGRGEDGERVAWNLVDGVHDCAAASERSVWIDGEPRAVDAVAFAADLSSVGELRFHEWSAREDHTNRLLVRSHYRQPFGSFEGTLPDGTRLAAGHGVMEWHDVHW